MNNFNLVNNIKIGFRSNSYIFSTNSMCFNYSTRKYFDEIIDLNFINNDSITIRSPENVVGFDRYYNFEEKEYFKTAILLRLYR